MQHGDAVRQPVEQFATPFSVEIDANALQFPLRCDEFVEQCACEAQCAGEAGPEPLGPHYDLGGARLAPVKLRQPGLLCRETVRRCRCDIPHHIRPRIPPKKQSSAVRCGSLAEFFGAVSLMAVFSPAYWRTHSPIACK
jgi:hypothetical protein